MQRRTEGRIISFAISARPYRADGGHRGGLSSAPEAPEGTPLSSNFLDSQAGKLPLPGTWEKVSLQTRLLIGVRPNIWSLRWCTRVAGNGGSR